MDQKRSNPHPRKNNRARLLVAVLLAAALLGGAYLLWPRQASGAVSASRLAADPYLGPESARITIIEYGDFGCTTCRGWEQAGVLKQIRGQYGDQIRFVWRDFPVITAQSPKAAEAGQCAYDQGKFWEYHDLLYQKAPALSVSDLKSYAAQVGMDPAKFNACLDSGRYKAKVDQSLQEAYTHGFQGTPAFLVNGLRLAGPASFDQFKKVIDPLL